MIQAELDRLRALRSYQILDSVPEDEFDTLARLVSGSCDTPIGLVSLVDAKRQWFKARIGLGPEETPRDVSFCSHAIQNPDVPFIVPDALKDERFADNPLVTGEPYIRFYAGVPLVTKLGKPLGTICVIDTVARTLTPQQLEALMVAAKAVMSLLEMRLTISELRRSNDSQVGVEAGLRQQLARHIDAEDSLRHAAARDELTKLPNRRRFNTALDAAYTTMKADQDGLDDFALLYLDIDRFAYVNDSFGRAAGDAVLAEAAARFTRAVRPCDLVARLGGDEFAILAPVICDAATVTELARSIELAFEPPFHIEGREHVVSLSIGIVLANNRYTRAEDILRDADSAMHASKAHGRRRFSIFNESLRERSAYKSGVAQTIYQGLREDRFRLAYQPIVTTPEGRIEGFEALLRWERSQPEGIPAGTFIEVAEETGSICALGEWVLREACRQLAYWNRNVPSDGEPLRMSVNVSAKQLNDRRFAEMVRQIVLESGIRPDTLALELTESAVMDNPEYSLGVLNEVADLGVEIHLDDFGMGYSSLSHVRRLRVNRIKIDRSFVSGDGDTLVDPILVDAIVSLAHRVNLKVIAEGVETEAQRQGVTDLGCDAIQGYLVSRPVPAPEAFALFRLTDARRIISS